MIQNLVKYPKITTTIIRDQMLTPILGLFNTGNQEIMLKIYDILEVLRSSDPNFIPNFLKLLNIDEIILKAMVHSTSRTNGKLMAFLQ